MNTRREPQWTGQPLTGWIYGSMIFWTVLFGIFAAVPFAVALCFPAHRSGGTVRRMVLLYGKLMTRVAVWPFLRVGYQDQAPEARDAGIYVFNHRSASDPFLVSALGVPAIQAVNGWPMRLPLYGFIARRAEYIDVTKMAYPEMLTHIRRLLDQNVPVIVFPEGTRSGSTRMNFFHSGIFRIATALKAPLYPAVIAGNECLPDRTFRFHGSGTILVRRLAPIRPEEYEKLPNAFLLKNLVRTRISAAAAEMDEQLRMRK